MRWVFALVLAGCTGIHYNLTVSVYPNPCYGERVTFKGDVAYGVVKIYNAKGQLVRTLREKEGSTEVVWDTKDENGNLVPSGVYVWEVKGRLGRCSGRITIVRREDG